LNVTRAGAIVVVAFILGLILSVRLVRAVPVWPHSAEFVDRETGPTAISDQSDDLDARRERLFWEVRLAKSLAAQLVEGTLSLADATKQMEPLLQARRGFECQCLPQHYNTPNVRLSVARYLINKVKEQIEANSSRSAAVIARLEAEYAALFRNTSNPGGQVE
jgi:hypothetical protein